MSSRSPFLGRAASGASSAPLRILVTGLLSGLLCVVFTLSAVALMFSGPLAPHLAVGLGLMLLATTVHVLVVGALSSYRGTVAGIASAEIVVLALIVDDVALHPAVAAQPGSQLPTVLAVIALASLLTGLAYQLVGTARLGKLIRYIPHPVMGGFVAGIGWLLLMGGFGIALARPVGLDNMALALGDPAALGHWLPALLLGLALHAVHRHTHHHLALPALLLLAAVLFFLVAWSRDASLDALLAGGWLLGPLEDRVLPNPLLLLESRGQIRWAAVTDALPQLFALVLILLGGAMLVSPALESTLRRSLDLDRELRAAGLSNLMAGLAGGAPGYHYLGTTSLARRLGAESRLVPLVAAAACLVVLLFGDVLLMAVPRIVVGGLVFFLAAEFMHDWLLSGYRQLARSDYAIVLAVFLVTVLLGFMEAVAIGLLLCVLFFALDYSRVRLVRRAFDGSVLHSRVSRSPRAEALLRRYGDAIEILPLEGYVFFGSFNRLFQSIVDRIADPGQPHLGYLVLDLRRVRGFDSSAASGFARLVRLAEECGIEVAVSSLPQTVAGLLRGAGVERERRHARPGKSRSADRRDARHEDVAQARIRQFSELDRALEWAEDRLLECRGASGGLAGADLHDHLREQLGGEERARRLLAYTEQREYAPGELLCAQGENTADLFLVEEGDAVAVLHLESGEELRLSRMGAGSTIGEVALYLGGQRTADVVALAPTRVRVLAGAQLSRLRAEEPELAADFHAMLARMLAQRLSDSARLVNLLMY